MRNLLFSISDLMKQERFKEKKSFFPGALMISSEVTGRSTKEYAWHGIIALMSAVSHVDCVL